MKKNQRKKQIDTKLLIPKSEFEKLLSERIKLGYIVLNTQINNEIELKKNREEYYSWNDYNSELLKNKFNNEDNDYKESYDNVNYFAILIAGGNLSLRKEIDSFKENIKNKINNLDSLLKRVELLKEEDEINIVNGVDEIAIRNNDVFIVHGHNNEIKETLARLLEKQKLNPIILHEQPNQGKTIIEKFEHNTEKVGFAIILLTEDDKGKPKNDIKFKYRARQNIILEMGYFIGKLGRNRICPLYSNGVELPNDLNGIVYTEIDSKGAWKLELLKELKAAGYDVDANKL